MAACDLLIFTARHSSLRPQLSSMLWLGVLMAIGLLFPCPASSDEPWSYADVACKGNDVLVRFGGAENTDPPEFSAVPLPAAANFDDVRVNDPSKCRLADGRLVVLRYISLLDGLPFGMCGAGETQVFSLWIGGQKIYSREIFEEKCHSRYLSILIHQGRSAACRPLTTEPYQQGFKCDDTFHDIPRPAPDSETLGSLKLLRASPGKEGFCRRLVVRAPWPETLRDMPAWKAHFSGTIDAIGDRTEADRVEREVDKILPIHFGENAKPEKILLVSGTDPGFYGSFWVLLGNDIGEDDLSEIGDRFGDSDEHVAEARQEGIKIYAGDQTAFGSRNHIALVPFDRAGRTWMHAFLAFGNGYTWMQVALMNSSSNADEGAKPTDIILQPSVLGELLEICAFRAVPPI